MPTRIAGPTDLGPWTAWFGQGFFFTEAARGGPLVWPPGADRLAGDPLGPIRHVHDDAAEYYFVLQGQCRAEVGGEVRVVGPGDLVYIPPNAPHNLLGEVGGADAWVFIVVSPNFMERKWRTSNFRAGSETLRMRVSRPFEGDSAASTYPVSANAVRLERDAPLSGRAETSELVYLIVNGLARVRVGRLGGTLAAGDYIHIRRGMPHELSGVTAETDILRFDCPFAQWAGVDLGPQGTTAPDDGPRLRTS